MRAASPARSSPMPASAAGPSVGTLTAETWMTVALKLALLLNQPKPSSVPRRRRVAPAGTVKRWAAPVPLPVRPSPMKKTCLSAGDRAVKEVVRPPGEKSSPAGAAVESGRLGPRKTPTSESAGAVIAAIPSLAGVETRPLPSGGSVGGLGTKLTLPVTLNVRTDPAVTLPTRTGDCAGAESPPQHVDPSGIPAR